VAGGERIRHGELFESREALSSFCASATLLVVLSEVQDQVSLGI